MTTSIPSKKLAVLFLCALFLVNGCGKKGNPTPDDERDKFTWAESGIQVSLNGCLSVTGILQGNSAKLTDVVFELQPIQDGDDCAGCPFTPSERAEFAESQLRGHPEVNTIKLNYCPREQAPVYRWRLVGVNIHRRFPYEVTPVQTFTVNEEPEREYAPFYLP